MRWLPWVLLAVALGCTPTKPLPGPPTLTPVPPLLELPPAVGAPAAPAGEGARAAPPAAATAAPSPTPLPGAAADHPADTEALAAAPSAEAPVGPSSGPTSAALPPSARAALVLTPTPNVVASSPVLAAAPPSAGVDYARAIKLVQDSRRDGVRLEERITSAIARARANGEDVEVGGWQAALKGNAETYQVTFALRENRRLLLAEWEVDFKSGAVRPANAVAEGLSGL